MKKIITGALAFMLIAGSAQAQKVKEHRKDGLEQLNLTAEQKTKLQALRADQKKAWAEWKKEDNITVKESQARKKELQQKYHAQVKAILTPEQQQQMATMRAGHHKGGKDRMMQKRKGTMQQLHLTSQQQDKVKNLNDGFKTKRATLRSNTTLSEAAKKEQMKTLAQQHRKDLKEVLTAEQQQKLEALRKEHKAGKSK